MRGVGLVVCGFALVLLSPLSASVRAQDPLTCMGQPATIVGTPGDDVLTGTAGSDVIVGGGGDDAISGEAGDDTICSDEGDEQTPTDGEDMIDDGPGDDAISAGGGDDKVTMGPGDDYAESGRGDDSLQGFGGDYYDGGPGNDDIVHGGDIGGYLAGAEGNDDLQGGVAVDYLDAGEGHDVLEGGGGTRDLGSGLLRGDFLDGGAGDDVFHGSDDMEYFEGGSGSDTIYARGGDDYLEADDAEASPPAAGDDVLFGGGGDDSLEAGAGDDQLHGGHGDDAFVAGDGSDVLRAVDSSVESYLDCGPGTDALYADPADELAGPVDCESGVIYDSDGDALPDDWERFGFDADGDGSTGGKEDIDLPELGTDPLRKDIFVEYDWIDGSTERRPSDQAIRDVVGAFDRAPVQNPGGKAGIALHVEIGAAIPNTPALAGVGTYRDPPKCEDFDPSEWHELAKVHRTRPSRAFHYAISVPAIGDPSGPCQGTIGISPQTGDDLLVAVDPYRSRGNLARAEAATLMHELGHNLGLSHGGVFLNESGNRTGPDDTNHKPMHFSVMNYLYNVRGVLVDEPQLELNFSIFDSLDSALQINENALREPDGIMPGADGRLSHYQTRWRCPDRSTQTAPATGPANWNCQGSPDEQVSLDLTGDGFLGELTTVNEWRHLVFRGGAIGNASRSLPSPPSRIELPAGGELTAEEDAQLGPYSPPTGTDDAYTAKAETPLNIAAPGLLANDTGEAIVAARAETATGGGTVTIAPDGGFTYVPANGFLGVDRFAYQVVNAAGVRTASVAINVGAAPAAGSGSLPAVVRASTGWMLRDSLSSGDPTLSFSYGTTPLAPLMGDWDGDGLRTAGTYDGGVFKLNNTNDGGAADIKFTFGDRRGFPVAGDFDADGTDDVAVYRNGLWQMRLSTGVTSLFAYGTGSWPATIPVSGDWDGDGRDGIGTYAYNSATWALRSSASTGPADEGTFAFGTPSSSYPVPGDWDADASDSVGIKTGGRWFLRNTNSPGAADSTIEFGGAADLPLTWRTP